MKPGTQAKLEFNLVAEGLRKIALLWQLIKNGTLEKGSVSKYIEVKRGKDNEVQYVSLYKEGDTVLCETAKEFELLEHNAIMDTFRQLYREEIGVVLR